ncbi:thiamine-phosphate kinase [Nocardia sp. NPDC003345]
MSTGPTVAEMGEFALISRINRGRVQGPAVRLGPGDDAAVLTAGRGHYAVSTDMLIEDRHFRLDWSDPEDIGRKAIAQNAADIYAMGAAPTGYVIGVGIPADAPAEAVLRLADGCWDEAVRAGGSVAGGDIVRSPHWVISVTAFGDPLGCEYITRSGARPGGTVAIAGSPGWSAAGYAVLMTPDITASAETERALAAHRAPRPPYGSVRDAIRDGRPPVALTDISDGLLADLGHIADASGVAVDISFDALADPALHRCAEAVEGDVRQWILTGGEDHVFAGVWPPGSALPSGWTAIGRIDAGHGVTVDGARYEGSRGWEAFAGTDSAKSDRSR